MKQIGIQGDLGSNNHHAARVFADRQQWVEYEIVPLRTTDRVLHALSDRTIEYGTFAWESSSGGLVSETQAAISKYDYTKLDELQLEIHHVLLKLPESDILLDSPVMVFSHPQALIEHTSFLQEFFSALELHEESDTAFAAMQLRNGAYPRNSLVIAPKECAGLYNLEIFEENLPSNEGYWTRFYLVESP